jgi:hypothetical protein
MVEDFRTAFNGGNAKQRLGKKVTKMNLRSVIRAANITSPEVPTQQPTLDNNIDSAAIEPETLNRDPNTMLVQY